MRSFLVAILAAVIACTFNEALLAESFIGPSGRPMHSTKCSRSPNDCYRSASQACAGPYKVLDSQSNAGGLVADLHAGPGHVVPYDLNAVSRTASFHSFHSEDRRTTLRPLRSQIVSGSGIQRLVSRFSIREMPSSSGMLPRRSIGSPGSGAC
jgi:hypothetical protein